MVNGKAAGALLPGKKRVGITAVYAFPKQGSGGAAPSIKREDGCFFAITDIFCH